MGSVQMQTLKLPEGQATIRNHNPHKAVPPSYMLVYNPHKL